MGMICPCCAQRLERVELADESAMICPDCAGLWLSREHFARFVKGLSCSGGVIPEAASLFRPRRVTTMHEVREATKRCPACRRPMVKFNFGYDSNVILDKCPDCKGIWTDEDEVRAVAGYMKRDPRVEAVAKGLIEVERLANPLVPEKNLGAALGRLGLLLPLSDDAPMTGVPIVTLVIMALSLVLYALSMSFSHATIVDRMDGFGDNSMGIGLFRPMFLGLGLPSFILMVVFLWLFGDNVESAFGHIRYLLLHLGCCGVGLVAYSTLGGGMSPGEVAMRAAVSGVLGAYIVLFPLARLRLFVFVKTMDVPAAAFIALWFVLQLARPWVVGWDPQPDRTWVAVAAGFCVGTLVGYGYKTARRGQSSQS